MMDGMHLNNYFCISSRIYEYLIMQMKTIVKSLWPAFFKVLSLDYFNGLKTSKDPKYISYNMNIILATIKYKLYICLYLSNEIINENILAPVKTLYSSLPYVQLWQGPLLE